MGKKLKRLAIAGLGTVVAMMAITVSAEAGSDVVGGVVQRTYAGAVAENNSETARPLYYSNPVYAGETVVTGHRGATELNLLDGTRVVVGSNARLLLDEFVYDPNSTKVSGHLQFISGSFRYTGGKSKSKEQLELETPVATLTIRGTELVVFIGEDGTTEVNVIEGSVTVKGHGGSGGTISAGSRASISASGKVKIESARAIPTRKVPTMPRSLSSSTATSTDTQSLAEPQSPSTKADRRRTPSVKKREPKPKPAPKGDDGQKDNGTGGGDGVGGGDVIIG